MKIGSVKNKKKPRLIKTLAFLVIFKITLKTNCIFKQLAAAG